MHYNHGYLNRGVGVGYLVDTQHFRGGAEVSISIGVGQVTVDKTSTNTVTVVKL